MFIRRKLVPKQTKDGRKLYPYYYLVKSERSQGKVRQKVIAYLGDASQASDTFEGAISDLTNDINTSQTKHLRRKLALLLSQDGDFRN